MWVAETDAGLAAITRTATLEAFLAPIRRRFPDHDIVADELDVGWLDGNAPPLDVTGLPSFDARVYEVVRSVPAGSTITYGEVAALIGSPGAARAVGGAMSRCPTLSGDPLPPGRPCIRRMVRLGRR